MKKILTSILIIFLIIVIIILSFCILNFNTEEVCVEYNNMCENVNIEDYNNLEEIEEEVIFDTFYVPENKGFKSYMDYKMITSVSSKQYKLQSEYANTGIYGIRTVDDRYCIAIGSYFKASIGQYVDLVLQNGTVIPCIIADQKDDIHTDENNIMTVHNGCVSEFVVETNSLDTLAMKMGDISYCDENWNSPVVEIKVYNKNVLN